jgi:antitoxin (DNA-binding transcriptional repressor) of toxin-antitoxin stability system
VSPALDREEVGEDVEVAVAGGPVAADVVAGSRHGDHLDMGGRAMQPRLVAGSEGGVVRRVRPHHHRVTLPERRDDPSSRTIEVPIMRLPAETPGISYRCSVWAAVNRPSNMG